MYNINMLIYALYFWEGLTNTFQICCGMITPTLFDVVAIIGLRPIWENFNPTIRNKIKLSFSFDHHSFNAYIKDHHDQTEEVSNYEHIDFLTLWLSHFTFCSSYIHMAKKLISLATQFHEGLNMSHEVDCNTHT